MLSFRQAYEVVGIDALREGGSGPSLSEMLEPVIFSSSNGYYSVTKQRISFQFYSQLLLPFTEIEVSTA